MQMPRDRKVQTAGLWSADLSQRYHPRLASREIADGDTALIAKYGQEFAWTSLHSSAEELEPLRLVGDEALDALLEEHAPRPSDDVYATLSDDAARHPEGRAAAFLRDMSLTPPWLDWDLIEEGQSVFCRFLPLASCVLFNMSLVGGFAAPKITKVLEASGYLVASPPAVMRRLVDTGRLLLDSCAAAGAM